MIGGEDRENVACSSDIGVQCRICEVLSVREVQLSRRVRADDTPCHP